MNDYEKYRKDLDLIFQEIDEKVKLIEQASQKQRYDYMGAIIRDRHISKCLQRIPPEDRLKLLQELLKLAFPKEADSN